MPDFRRGIYSEEIQAAIDPYLAEIERLRPALSGLPGRLAIRRLNERRVAENSRHLSDSDRLRVEVGVVAVNSLALLQVFLVSTGYKVRQLLDALIDGFNERKYLIWTLVSRSLIEHCAVSSHYKVKLDQHRMLRGVPEIFSYQDLRNIHETLAEYVQGTRYDWEELLEGDPLRERIKGDLRSAINVLTTIDKLEKSSPEFDGVRRAYDFLSDFCHPNMGNQLLVTEDAGAESGTMIVAELPNAPFFELVIWRTIPTVTVCLQRIVQIMSDGFKIYEHWSEHVVGNPWEEEEE